MNGINLNTLNVELEEKGTQAIYMREDKDYHYYYANIYSYRINYKIPVYDAEMIYPGIPAHVLSKYIDEVIIEL